ncbi:MAG: hypothetical protein AB7P17_02895 [Nitrospirales bacterium]|nr:hypothetical protein [Nitrospirales bacterium]
MALSIGRIGACVFFSVLCHTPLFCLAQNLITDQVSITVERDQIFGITSGEGIARQFLASGEEIVVLETRGVTGYVQTTKRLLGFSGQMRRWVELPLASGEQIVQWAVTPWLVLVIGKRQGYGFQSDLGRWKKESWGAGEMVGDVRVKSYVGLVTTNRRAMAFSAITGGFFSRDLLQPIGTQDVQINDHIVLLHEGVRTFVFRSGLAIWAELP